MLYSRLSPQHLLNEESSHLLKWRKLDKGALELASLFLGLNLVSATSASSLSLLLLASEDRDLAFQTLNMYK